MYFRKELEKAEQFTTSEKKIAAYILTHEQEFLTLTVRALAEITYTSPAVVMRIVKKLVNGNYTDFQSQYANELRNHPLINDMEE